MSRSRAWPWILLLLTLGFVQRAGIVLAPKATLYGQPAGGDPGIKFGEEIARGNVAVDLLEGPILPLIDYQYAHFFGGSLVVGILTVPSFALFGPRLWALKLVPLLVHLAGVLLLFRLLDRHASRRAAVFGGLLYALSPPGYAQLTTVAWGSHIESNTLALGALSLYLGLRTSERRPMRRFGLGLLLGFGLYFGYQFALVIAALACFDLRRDGRPSAREALGQVAGMAIGFSPWLIYNLGADFAGLSIYGGGVGDHLGQSGLGARVVQLFTHGLPGALFIGSRGLELVSAGLLATLAAVGVANLARPARVAGVYGLGFLVAYALSDFRIGKRPEAIATYRYAMLLAPWVAIAVGCGLDALAARREKATAAVWTCAIALALFFWVTAWTVSCDAGRIGADRDAPGADLEAHGRWLCMKLLDHPDRIPDLVSSIVERRDEQDQAVLFGAMGEFLLNMAAVGPKADERRREEAKRMSYSAAVYRAEVPAIHRGAFRR